MEFSSTERNLGADSDTSLILSTHYGGANIEKLAEEIERLNLDMPVLVIHGCVRSVSSVLCH